MTNNTTVSESGSVTMLRRKEQISGLVDGTIIMTLAGEKAIQDLASGDRVITRDSGMAVVKAIRMHTVTVDTVTIKAGSLGHTRPDCDVTVPADQKIFIRDWRAEAMFGSKQAMIPASRLVDGEFVTLARGVEMTVYEIEFDGQHVIYADGLEVSSFIDQQKMSAAA